MIKNTKINTKYKDRLFRLLFGSYEMKDNILSLYNALNGTEYDNADDLEIITLDDAVYIKMKNDVSLLIDSHISLWEHQSSFNPNMPVRGFMYYGNLYNKYIEGHGLNIYGSKLVKIPNPKYIVFYNGKEDIEPVIKLKLSDAFINEDKTGEFEWTATMYNLNKGKNDELLSKCKPLADYMELINRIKDNQEKGMIIEKAVDRAVVSCIKDGIMAEYLKNHREDVMSSCITEFNEEVYEKGIREEGLIEGMRKQIYEFISEGVVMPLVGADKLNITVEELKERMKKEGYNFPK